METKSVKQAVVESYGKLAQTRKKGLLNQLFACCNPAEGAQKVATAIGYSEQELQDAPQDSNLGVGCGNPAALALIKEGETVVDLGSGAGFDAFIVSHKVGPQGKVIGVDLSEDMLKLARKNAHQGNFTQVEFVQGDIENLPLPHEIADHVISNCVINLSLRKDLVYQEAFRILKPGGKLSISDIILEKELPEFIKQSLGAHIACISGAEKLENYLSYIQKAGFQNINIESSSTFPLELMLADPHIQLLAKKMNIDLMGKEAKEMASRVKSVSISATK
ncbi:MAG: arsenite methyltransferase [Bacteroidota bacterium]